MDLGKTIRKIAGTAMIGLAAIASDGCAGLTPKPDFYPTKGQPNTMTYVDKKTGKEVVVYNLNGEWNYQASNGNGVINITQKEDKVDGTWKEAIPICSSGGQWFSGQISGNLVTGTRYLCTSGIDALYMRVNEKGNKAFVNILINSAPSVAELISK